MPVNEKIHCWKYFSCNKSSCPAYGNEQDPCWLFDTTLCSHKDTLDEESKAIICVKCSVFEQSTDLESVKTFIRKHYHAMVTREHMANQRNLAFSEALSRMLEVVEKLCKGDPSARIEDKSNNILVRKLEEGINQLAMSIAENVADSHEQAIGICEHYDVLNRLAAGDLGVRASESSSNELIAQLGVLINKGTDALGTIIKQLKTSEEDRNFAYQKMRDIVDFLPDATFVVDKQGSIIAWNKAIEEMTGFLKADMLGKGEQTYSVPFYGEPCPVLLDFLDKDITLVNNQYSQVKRVGNKLYAEAHVPAFSDRSDIYLWVTAAPLIDQKGNRIGAVESIRDVTDYRKAEIDRLNLESQLLQSQKMEAIGLLAGGIAHDFNNLLTAIIGYASLLQIKVGEQTQLQHYIHQINACTTKATKLTQDLLAFSRKRILNPEPMDLNRVISKMQSLLSRLLTEDIEFSVNFECDTLMTIIDKGMIEQVLMNLVANARDALPHGGVVNIRTSIAENMETLPGTEIITGTSYAVISVSDNGSGMDEETTKKVFEPFFTTKEIGKGTGLGLSTVYGIISQHKGTITVASEPGRGTTFSIYLPLLDQPISEVQESQETFTSFAVGGTELILLAEDNAETRSVTEEILKAAGYDVISTANGEEAIKKYREHGDRINLVLMDVIMPIKNGREVYEEVKRLNPLARCLFTSGYTADIIHTKGKIDKEFDYLPKPSRPNEMLNKVREILDRI